MVNLPPPLLWQCQCFPFIRHSHFSLRKVDNVVKREGYTWGHEVEIGRPLGHQGWSQSGPAEYIIDQDDCDDHFDLDDC